MYVIGIDAGGSKTVCQLGEADGRVLREARGPGANLQSAGELQVEKVLHGLLDEVLAGRAEPPAAICLGMAGVDRAGDSAVVRGILDRLCRGTRTLVVNDALIALEAGAAGRPGVVLIAGTGSIAYGRDADGRAARSGGWGHVLGDEGSGFWLGRKALRAVLRAADRRGEPTTLTDKVMAHFGVDRARDLVHPVYDAGAPPRAVAALAPLVGAAAEEGDDLALQIVELGAHELTMLAVSVAYRLGLETSSELPLVLSGGIFRSLTRIRERVIEKLATVMPDAKPALLDVEPASGALRFAAQLSQGSVRVPVYLDAAY